MKTKFLTVLAMLACTMLVSAQSFNRIYVNISQGTASDQVRLFETPSFTAAYDNNYDVVKMSLNSDIYIYAMAPNAQSEVVAHSKVYTNDLQGLVLGYQAAADGLATITFSDLRSDLNDVTEYYLLDQENGQLTVIGDTYEFNAVAGNDPNRFMIVKPVSVTTNAYGWATFSYSQNLVPVDADAQTIYKGSISGDALNLTAVAYVKAGEGVIVYGAPSTTYYFAVGSGSADFTGNALKATATYNTSMKNVYVLKGNAFLEYVGTNALAANKAYIQLPEAGQNKAPARIRMVINGTQDVENAEAEAVKAEKFIENGQVLIRRGNEVYNLQGQIVK